MNILRIQHHRTPDIRMTCFTAFASVLVSHYPQAFGLLNPLNADMQQNWLQYNLRIPSLGCCNLYTDLAYHFGLVPCEFNQYKLARFDHTIGELYHLLQHEAHQAARVQPYR